ncbi:MAG TPA: type II toxin-antitoxin system prevent-host-death family antitoxin [Pseudomonadales bacterium]|jgi:prevent-host-death family protein|nr:type II toxin-antitoxin system prevent-host-death family antitoxin [Pseudomonadales bacterium]HRG51053.1 type II toxin-antitoxin system prevent-host-death family antitoxin [Pseudomonadales bacterium]
MLSITATELRKHLFDYLEKAEHGETVAISRNGRVVACLKAEATEADQALNELREMRAQFVVGDVVAPLDNQGWTGDAGSV